MATKLTFDDECIIHYSKKSSETHKTVKNVECDLTVYLDTRESETNISLNRKIFTDNCIRLDEKFFKRLLVTRPTEQELHIAIPFASGSLVIGYIHSGTLCMYKEDLTVLLDTIKLSHLCQLQRLKAALIGLFYNRIDKTNWCMMMNRLSEPLYAKISVQLKEKCWQFIEEKWGIVSFMETENFRRLGHAERLELVGRKNILSADVSTGWFNDEEVENRKPTVESPERQEIVKKSKKKLKVEAADDEMKRKPVHYDFESIREFNNVKFDLNEAYDYRISISVDDSVWRVFPKYFSCIGAQNYFFPDNELVRCRYLCIEVDDPVDELETYCILPAPQMEGAYLSPAVNVVTVSNICLLTNEVPARGHDEILNELCCMFDGNGETYAAINDTLYVRFNQPYHLTRIRVQLYNKDGYKQSITVTTSAIQPDGVPAEWTTYTAAGWTEYQLSSVAHGFYISKCKDSTNEVRVVRIEAFSRE